MYRFFIKRLLDIFLSLFFFIVLGWLFLLISICLYFANKGAGIFFLQERPGLGGEHFKILKFKTMTDERDKEGNLLPDHQRLTKIGSIIRSLSIDELPQFFNVLKGEMSLIGPRPLLIEYMPYYSVREQLRHSVRPGITGWAQVHGRNHLPWDERLELDAWYAENLSLKVDFMIFVKTIKNVIQRKDVSVDTDAAETNLAEERRSKL